MVRNNIICLAIHACVGISVWFLMDTMSDIMVNRAVSNEFGSIGFLCISALGLAAYYILGRKWLQHQLTPYHGFLSVSFVSIIGVLLWIYCFFFTEGGWPWLFYLFYNMASYSALAVMPHINEWFLVCFSVLPSVFLWLGMRKRMDTL